MPMPDAPIVTTMSDTTSSAASPTSAVSVSDVSPTPTDEEVVAIMAGVEALWPKPAMVVDTAPRSTAWRFSGRWWSRPVPARRDRPFR
jgi:hypothetical protein